MRVAMYYDNRDVRLENLPKPPIGQGEILMKTVASGVCGSDVLEWYRAHSAPRVLGHEVTGIVADIGDGVSHRLGDRIIATHHLPCKKCIHCLDGHHTVCDQMRKTNFDPGGFSEYIRLPRLNVECGVLPLPSSLSFEEGTFIEPLACVLRGQRHARVKPHHTLLVLGCGVSGLLHIRLAKARKSKRIIATDLSSFRLNEAMRSGADAVIDARADLPKRLLELNENKPADRVLVCTGARSASDQALRLVNKGGTILFFAAPGPDENVSVPITDYWLCEKTMTSSYGASPDDLAESLELLDSRAISVKDMITHRLPLAETKEGFRLVSEADRSLKVIVEPQK